MKVVAHVVALTIAVGILSLTLVAADATPNSTQLGKLYQLQAAWHRAASVHDAINGDSADVINERIRDMLSLWAEDGVLAPISVLPDGSTKTDYYIGRGNLDDNCPAPSAEPNNRGTI